MNHYDRIAEALDYLALNFRDQPSLSDLAERVHLSESHFQKVFTQWAGVSPKKFLQVLTLEYARTCLDASESVMEASMSAGLSGPSRLHDLFVSVDAMTPGEYRQGGEGLTIEYGFGETAFGQAQLMWTSRGITSLEFVDADEQRMFERCSRRLPKASYIKSPEEAARRLSVLIPADSSTANPTENSDPIRLLMAGTEFQLHVWQALLRIPEGSCVTYGRLAGLIGKKNAARAVGNAVGANPVACLIPCHRVIRETGLLGGYRWGSGRKSGLLGLERLRAAQ